MLPEEHQTFRWLLTLCAAAFVMLITPYTVSQSGWFQPNTLSFEIAKGLPAAIITAIVGLFVAGIALRQYNVAKAKLSLDLFERRLEIFNATWGYLSSVIHEGTKRHGDATFSNLLPQAQFLFGPEIRAYMEEAASNLGDLWLIEQDWQHGFVGKGEGSVQRRRNLLMWFGDQASEGCRAKFSPYLDFGQWR